MDIFVLGTVKHSMLVYLIDNDERRAFSLRNQSIIYNLESTDTETITTQQLSFITSHSERPNPNQFTTPSSHTNQPTTATPAITR